MSVTRVGVKLFKKYYFKYPFDLTSSFGVQKVPAKEDVHVEPEAPAPDAGKNNHVQIDLLHSLI